MKWAIDAMLGDVARYMLILGEDVLFRPDYSGERFADIAYDEHRIFLTTSLRKFSMMPDVEHLVIPDSLDNIWDKLRFIKQQFKNSFYSKNLFSRCLLCNILIVEIHPDEPPANIPMRVLESFTLYQCPKCKKVYWKGGHFDRTKQKLLQEHILDD